MQDSFVAFFPCTPTSPRLVLFGLGSFCAWYVTWLIHLSRPGAAEPVKRSKAGVSSAFSHLGTSCIIYQIVAREVSGHPDHFLEISRRV